MNQSRARIVFAAVATAVLAAGVVAFAVSGSSDQEASPDECLTDWNDDSIARSDGVHAYLAHTYRATLLARLDPQGEIVASEGAPTAQERCAVVFASPRVDSEPDFGVRVLDKSRWAGLVAVDRVTLDHIAQLQRDATGTANVTLLPDGRLAD